MKDEIIRLTDLWYKIVSTDHHKDRELYTYSPLAMKGVCLEHATFQKKYYPRPTRQLVRCDY